MDCIARRGGSSGDRYSHQARTVAAGAILSSIVSLSGVGVGLWLIIYSQDFRILLGIPLIDAFAGYCVLAGYSAITGIIGACVSVLRSPNGLLSFAVLLISNLVCQGTIFAYLFTKTKSVASGMTSALEENIDCRTFVTLEYKFFCSLETIVRYDDSCVLSTDMDVQSCSQEVRDWLERGSWVVLSVSAVLIAFQLILLLTSLLLRHMIREIPNYSGGCLPGRSSKTAPVLINVTPAPTPSDLAWLEDPFSPIQSSEPPLSHLDTNRDMRGNIKKTSL